MASLDVLSERAIHRPPCAADFHGRLDGKLDEPNRKLLAAVLDYDVAIEAAKAGSRVMPVREPTVLDSLRAVHPAIGAMAGVR